MKILCVSDTENPAYWDHYRRGMLSDIDLIISCGDLKSDYLSFLVTMGHAPVFYVHGNHDEAYDTAPPEGCDCIEDKVVEFKGLRIAGFGGSARYRPGSHQYTEREMERRIFRQTFRLRRGLDIVVTHAPPEGCGDLLDNAHRGFAAFLSLMNRYHPKYLLHGHVHMNYGRGIERERSYGDTTVINVSGTYILEI